MADFRGLLHLRFEVVLRESSFQALASPMCVGTARASLQQRKCQCARTTGNDSRQPTRMLGFLVCEETQADRQLQATAVACI